MDTPIPVPKVVRALFALGATSGLLGCATSAPGDAAAPAPPRMHQHGGAAQAAAPQLAVSAAFAPDGSLWLVGLETDAHLGIRVSRDEGRTWSTPRLLDTGRDRIAAAGENRPKIAFGPNGWVVISYTQPLAKPYTGEIRMLRSEDEGRSFSAPFTVHRDRQVITHRFESIAFDAKGTLHTLWIDKRDAEAARAGAAVGAARSATSYAGAAVYRNESTDGGRTFGPDLKLADHSCECCRIALAPRPDGGLAAMWRHVFGHKVRDHAFAPVAGRRGSVVRATFDEWQIDACPHHGPGLAAAADGGYYAVWFGERAGHGAVRLARLSTDGAPLGEVREAPDPGAEHADVASVGARVVVVWRSFDGSATVLVAWISRDAGATFVRRELARTADENDHPRLVVKGESVFAVWRTAREIKVERIEP